MDLKGRNFLTLKDFTPEEITYMIDLAADLKAKKKAGELHLWTAWTPGIPDSFFKKDFVNLLVLVSGKKSDCYFGIGVDKSTSQGITVKIMNQNYISIEKAPHNRGDLIVKDPHST